ncbi:MAG: hypothetical protein ACKOCO_18225 [Bacteroidota bacterium]
MKQVTQALIQGMKTGYRLRYVSLIVYSMQLLLALSVGMQIREVLEASVGHSLEIKKLFSGYDHTVIMDFLKVHGASLTPLFGQLRWLLLVWLITSVFLNGGLLLCAVHPERISRADYWHFAAVYFNRFLKTALIFLILALLWTALLFVPLLIALMPMLESFQSETTAIGIALLVVAVWLTGCSVLFVWSLLTRIRQSGGNRTWPAVRAGWRDFQGKNSRYIQVVALFLAVQLLLAAIYLLLSGTTGTHTGGGIFVVFLLQQLFVYSRIVLRGVMYSTVRMIQNG